jgi:hypothetical protein
MLQTSSDPLPWTGVGSLTRIKIASAGEAQTVLKTDAFLASDEGAGDITDLDFGASHNVEYEQSRALRVALSGESATRRSVWTESRTHYR